MFIIVETITCWARQRFRKRRTRSPMVDLLVLWRLQAMGGIHFHINYARHFYAPTADPMCRITFASDRFYSYSLGGRLTSEGVPGAPGTSWTGSRSSRFE